MHFSLLSLWHISHTLSHSHQGRFEVQYLAQGHFSMTRSPPWATAALQCCCCFLNQCRNQVVWCFRTCIDPDPHQWADCLFFSFPHVRWRWRFTYLVNGHIDLLLCRFLFFLIFLIWTSSSTGECPDRVPLRVCSAALITCVSYTCLYTLKSIIYV